MDVHPDSPSVGHEIEKARNRRSRIVKRDERKKVSRACDKCKLRKVRCSGTQPCHRCNIQGLICKYNAEHRRGRPPSPESIGTLCPVISAPGSRREQTPPGSIHVDKLSERTTAIPKPPSPQSMVTSGSLLPLARAQHADIEVRRSERNSQDPDETRFEGHYIGPTSGIAFLHRAQRKFKQDFQASISDNDNGRNPTQLSVFSFGDGPSSDYSLVALVLPSKERAKHLLGRYFDFAIPTYRFFHRATVENWLGELYKETEDGTQNGCVLSNAKAAVIYMVLATATLYREDNTGTIWDGEGSDVQESGSFFAAAENRLAKEPGPLRLASVQARLAQVLYLLGSSRINQAWYIFGTTCQMIVALGLHRKRYSQSSEDSSGLIEVECRRRAFWSAYTLDRYLSVILGRPRTFRDEDIDQPFPEAVNDTELTSNRKVASSSGQSVADAPVLHARLASIIGRVSSDLYPTHKSSNWIEHAERHTAELKEWKASLPAFLDASQVDPSILIPTFQRQSTVLRLAYAHALILANRQALLSNFANLNRRQDASSGELEGGLKECIDAAFLVVDTVNNFLEQGKMYKTFWFTHYVSFCAISSIYVYVIQQSSSSLHATENSGRARLVNAFEAAQRCQQGIADTTAKTSPFRRYNIILDELKTEVMYHLGKLPVHSAITTRLSSVVNTTENMRHHDVDFGQYGASNVHYPANASDTGEAQGNSLDESGMLLDGSLLDPGLFGFEGELVGWSEFDSCAIGWSEGLDWIS